jgi:MFS family permease
MLKLITIFLVSSLTVMAGATIAPALPKIQEAFVTTPNSEFYVKLMLTLPGLFTAVGAPFAGGMIDRFGRRPLLIVSIFIYGLAGGVAGFVLNDIPGLLIARAILGLAVAAIMTAAVALVADYYQGAQRTQVMGQQAAFMGLGGVLFLLLSGFLAGINWRLPFAVYLLSWLILPLVILALPEPQRSQATITISIDKGRDPEKLPVKTLVLVYFLNFAAMLTFYMTPAQLPFYLRSLGVNQSTQVGFAIAATTLTSAMASMGYGWLKARFSFTQIPVILFSFMAAGYGIVMLSSAYPGILLGQLLVGCGIGLAMPNMNVWVSNITPALLRGKTLGGLTTSMFLGQFFCPILTQPIVVQLGFKGTYGTVVVFLGLLAIALQFLQQDPQDSIRTEN